MALKIVRNVWVTQEEFSQIAIVSNFLWCHDEEAVRKMTQQLVRDAPGER